MNFALDEDQRAVQELARQILTELVTDDSLKALERDGAWFHAAAWEGLASAELLGVGLSESVGGAGFGATELAIVAREIGRVAGPLPFVDTCFGAAWALASADADVRGEVLGPLLAGKHHVAVAIEDVGAARCVRSAAGTITGTKTSVLVAAAPAYWVVSALDESGAPCVSLVAAGDRVEVAPQRSTDGATLARVTFRDASSRLLPVDATVLRDRLRVGIAAETLGVCDRALSLSAEYTRTRHQFGVPVGTFQAVKQRIADAFVDLAALEVVTMRAAGRLDTAARADVARAAASAALWAADAGHRITTAAQHLHGGMGFDRDYPVHRCFLRAKRLEFTLGAAPQLLSELGDALAERFA
ncbi:MAG: acyl-CoA/acyl-ACP dehydrogenase [Myxococcales bacterium]|nr:acyl-CoA/acyl-ACP dehydrogenase [Myxococcales bacterium]